MSEEDEHMLHRLAKELHQHFCGEPHPHPTTRIDHEIRLEAELSESLEQLYGPFDE